LSEKICNENAAQTMFCQSQAFPTEKKQKKSDSLFSSFSKKAKGVQKKPEFQNLPSKESDWQACCAAFAWLTLRGVAQLHC